jgi:hypothetical protein
MALGIELGHSQYHLPLSIVSFALLVPIIVSPTLSVQVDCAGNGAFMGMAEVDKQTFVTSNTPFSRSPSMKMVLMMTVMPMMPVLFEIHDRL